MGTSVETIVTRGHPRKKIGTRWFVEQRSTLGDDRKHQPGSDTLTPPPTSIPNSYKLERDAEVVAEITVP